MIRKYILTQLTQLSTWIGLIIIVSVLLFPRTWIVFIGIGFMITDDTRLNKFFEGLRKDLEKWWVP